MSAAVAPQSEEASAQRSQPPDHRKPCTLCHKPRDVLVRCQIDETGKWHFICPGSCWQRVSGGKIDGDDALEHQWYRYGGMWKNKHEAVSAKKPKHKKNKSSGAAGVTHGGAPSNVDDMKPWSNEGVRYTQNDKVRWNDVIWICRRSHVSEEKKTPEKAYRLWKEENSLVEDPD